MEWTAQKIRETFLEFYRDKNHKIVPSAPMVVKNDPTLMFTNAGMNQFKDIFLGYSDPKDVRVADSQKCLRVSGKHNDLDEVGADTYHHTMFEMLGNWSFGDYFKEETIAWAWELLTQVYKLDKDRIFVTVFGGDKEDGLGADLEARTFWEKIVAPERVLDCDKTDNFWEMGETGPCGPCSEIHVDLRSDEDRQKVDGRTLVNQDDPLVVEVWNLVFIQYNRKADKSLEELPSKHIDTGMGFERLAMALQGKTSNYDTDVFGPLIAEIEKITGKKYGVTTENDMAIRVIADHIRAISFSIADGQLPSSNKAGYVIRRILRRAVRYGYSFLGCEEPFMYKLVPVLEREMGKSFPELTKQKELIEKAVFAEEEMFLQRLESGLKLIQNLVDKTKGDEIPAKEVFILKDRYGFPEDLTSLILSEQGKSYNLPEFKKYLKEQKDATKEDAVKDTGDWVDVLTDFQQVEFIGYDETAAEVQIARYRKLVVKGKEQYQLVLNRTPFYPEGGGQVGDTGYLEANGAKWSIVDTRKENNLIVHLAPKLPDDPAASFHAVVNQAKRESCAQNHTATHLLHQALREVLGTHVEQKGSLVHPDYLRFDFSHFSRVTAEELQQIERLVNQRIRANFPLNEHREMPIDEAMNMGAMALFGEKYGDSVRLIKFGESVELCGGIHVPATGSIGYFKITSEGSSSTGIRRIEAITSEKAEAYLESNLETLKSIRGMLKNPKDVAKAIEELLDKNQKLGKELEKLNRDKAANLRQDLLASAKDIQGIRFVGQRVDLPSDLLKSLAFEVKQKEENLVMVLGSSIDGKAILTVVVTEDLVNGKNLHAGKMIRELAAEIGGGGGGQPFFATAGGKKPEGLDKAIQKAETMLS